MTRSPRRRSTRPPTRIEQVLDREPPGFYLVQKADDGKLYLRPRRVITAWRIITSNRFLAFVVNTVQAAVASVAIYFMTAMTYAALHWIRKTFGADSVATTLEGALSKIGDLGGVAAFAWFTLSGLITDVRAWWREISSPPPLSPPASEEQARR